MVLYCPSFGNLVSLELNLNHETRNRISACKKVSQEKTLLLQQEIPFFLTRRLRIEFEGAVYPVTAKGNERKNIFFSKTDYKKFLEYPAEAKKKLNINVHGYVED